MLAPHTTQSALTHPPACAQDLTAEQLQEMAQRAQQASGEGGSQGRELQISLEGMDGGGQSGSECAEWPMPAFPCTSCVQ